MRSFVALATLAGLASAHFKLKYPPTVGFEDEKEATAPCGGFTPDLDGKLADFHIGGDAVAVRLSHPQCNWLYRVTTEPSDDKSWEQIYPIVMQNGLGDFCIPQLTVPEKYEGKKGVISIVSSAVDGLLYQCSAVNFVKGSQDAPKECTNATSVSASFTSDKALSALVGSSSAGDSSNSSTSSGGSDGSTTSSGSKPSSTDKDNAAGSLQAGSGLAALGVVLGGIFMI